jgi:hypothetical protein
MKKKKKNCYVSLCISYQEHAQKKQKKKASKRKKATKTKKLSGRVTTTGELRTARTDKKCLTGRSLV